jgi:hypothetical protein
MATFDMTAYSRLWRDRQGRFARMTAGGAVRLAQEAQRLSRQMMERLIYSIPETRSSSGKPLWVRTRNLINHEEGRATGPGAVSLVNSVVYARSRHELGRDGRQTTRPAHWRDKIRESLRAAQLAIYESALVDWMRG